MQEIDRPVVHLELHTADLGGARELYAALCGWRLEPIQPPGRAYVSLELADGVGGGLVGCAAARPTWLPYVRVPDVEHATCQASALGARVLLEPREGPAGWRSVIVSSAGGELAFWQPRR